MTPDKTIKAYKEAKKEKEEWHTQLENFGLSKVTPIDFIQEVVNAPWLEVSKDYVIAFKNHVKYASIKQTSKQALEEIRDELKNQEKQIERTKSAMSYEILIPSWIFDWEEETKQKLNKINNVLEGKEWKQKLEL